MANNRMPLKLDPSPTIQKQWQEKSTLFFINIYMHGSLWKRNETQRSIWTKDFYTLLTKERVLEVKDDELWGSDQEINGR